MYKDFFKLFEGDPDKYITSTLIGVEDNRGKKEATYTTVHEAVTPTIWKDHLDGKVKIGIRPENKGLCKWGCVDVDPENYKDYSEKKYVDILREYKLPLVPVKSKSGGLHLFLFLKDWSPINEVQKILNKWNDQFFMSKEIFPGLNKAVTMPYYNAMRTMEHAYDHNNTPLMAQAFLDFAKKNISSLDQLKKLEIEDYLPEDSWDQYPPCVQNMIQNKWHSDGRNEALFQVGVLEQKKADGKLGKKELEQIILKRNLEIFPTPLQENEVIATVCKSLQRKDYQYKCPPKNGRFAGICDKEKCKRRKLGVGVAVPDVIDVFKEIHWTRDTKTTHFSFKYEDKFITVKPEDMKDEKSWFVKLLHYGVLWDYLPKSRANPNPFQSFLREFVTRATENKNSQFADKMEEEQYNILKGFFESTIEVDEFNKLKDGYVVLDSKTNICYFKQTTLENFLNKSGNKNKFNSTLEAIRLLNCDKHENFKKERNVWYVAMPEFESYTSIKKTAPVEKKVSELDDEYHTGKFKT